jgi:glycosyltransferase involved in cell wall biosynthesis
MNPFTGGCDYDNNCGRYIECCGSCPQLGSNQDKGLSFQIWQRKKKALSYVDSKQLHIVSPSKWLAEKATKSSLLNKFPISVIPNGIDTDVFFPTNQKEARQKLNLPLAAKIVLFIASSLTIVRKGGILLVESLNKLRDSNNLLVATVGQDELKIDKHIKTHHFGYIHDNDPLLSLIYSAADIFIAPSLQENFSNTVLESFACGTPVIGFDVGGMPDMVRKGVTGELAEINDVYSLCNAIAKLLKNDAIREDMSRNCRRIALTEYSLEVQAKKYIHLYESMLGTKSIGQ